MTWTIESWGGFLYTSTTMSTRCSILILYILYAYIKAYALRKDIYKA